MLTKTAVFVYNSRLSETSVVLNRKSGKRKRKSHEIFYGISTKSDFIKKFKIKIECIKIKIYFVQNDYILPHNRGLLQIQLLLISHIPTKVSFL